MSTADGTTVDAEGDTSLSESGYGHRAGTLRIGRDGHESGASVPKLATGIVGLDHVSMGGLPARRATVVAGQAGCTRTRPSPGRRRTRSPRPPTSSAARRSPRATSPG